MCAFLEQVAYLLRAQMHASLICSAQQFLLSNAKAEGVTQSVLQKDDESIRRDVYQKLSYEAYLKDISRAQVK